jgi:hypothetical protein
MKQFNFKVYLLVGMAIIGFSGSAIAGAFGGGSIANCGGGGVIVDATHITWTPNGTVAGTGCMTTGIGTSITYTGGGGGTLGPDRFWLLGIPGKRNHTELRFDWVCCAHTQRYLRQCDNREC